MIGGTVNQTGSLQVKVEQVGANTVLAHIIRLVEQAQGSKLPIQALVDRITLWFVPAVMVDRPADLYYLDDFRASTCH